MININDLNTVELLGYVYSAIHKLEWSYIISKDENKFKNNVKFKDLNKFIKNFIYILKKLNIEDFNEDIKKSFQKYDRHDVSIYEDLDIILYHKYQNESKIHIGSNKTKYNYDLSLLSADVKWN